MARDTFDPYTDQPASAYPGGNAPWQGTDPSYTPSYEWPAGTAIPGGGVGTGGGAPATSAPTGAASGSAGGGSGFDPSDIFIGGDDNVYGTKRTYSTDPATGKTVYGYETVLLGPRSNLAAVSAASGIPVAALQSTPAFLSGRVTVDPDGKIWTQSGNGVRTPVTEQQIVSGQVPGVTVGDLTAARSQALESQRTLAQAGQYTYGGIDPSTGQVMLRKGDGSLVPYVAGQTYAGLDLGEVQRSIQQTNDQNFQSGSFSMPGTAGYQPGQSFNATQLMYGGSGASGAGASAAGSSLTAPQASSSGGASAMGAPTASGGSSYTPGAFLPDSRSSGLAVGSSPSDAMPSPRAGGGTGIGTPSSMPTDDRGAGTGTGTGTGAGTGTGTGIGTGTGTGGGPTAANPWGGLTNQQAQQTANQAQTGKTLSLIGKFGNITAGPGGSYSGTDFYGGHQQLSANQLTGSGSATDAELYAAQSDYSQQMRRQQQALRASTSRYLSGYDPNQVHSSVAGM